MTAKSYKVLVRRKIPYLTNLFLAIGGICFLIILLFDLIFSPLKFAGQETQAAIFYWLVPEFWKKVLAFSTIGFCVTAIIYAKLRYHKAAILSFADNEILLRGKTFTLTIPTKSIRKIYCNDATTISGQSKKKLSITIEQKRKRKATAIRLKDYEQSEEFMEQLMDYKGLDFTVYDFAFNPIHNEES